MPRKSKLEEEREIDVGPVQEEKKKTFASNWFDTNCVNNKKELRYVCDLTARSVAEQFSMVVRSNNTEVFAVIFYATFMSIMEYIKSKQKTYSQFSMQIANSLNIGYTNNDDDENEKVGSYLPFMEYVGINRSIIHQEDDDEYTGNTSATNYIRWRQLNTKKEVEMMKEVQNNAYQKLQSEYHISLRTEEAVIPIFCIFLDNLVSVAKELYKQADGTGVSEVSINVFGLFEVYYSYDEEAQHEVIEYQPEYAMKLFIKDDSLAARE